MEICRLCLDLLYEKNFLKLSDPYKCIINNVIPEVDLDLTVNPVICNKCSTSIEELHKFKLLCYESQQQLKQKCSNANKTKLSVNEILCNINIPNNTKERICRTCLEPIECDSFTVLTPSSPDAYLDSMLTMCLPEVDLEISQDPVMCENCLGNLQKLHHLKTVCLDIEDKLKSYKSNFKSKNSVHLQNVLESLQELCTNNSEPEFSIENVKKENLDETVFEASTNLNLHVTAELTGVKHEKMNFKMKESASSNIDSQHGKIYACAFCNADFHSKSELKKHRKIHAGQVKTYDCDRCPSRFTLESEYYSHIKFGHGKVVKPYVCKVCQTSSISEVGLYRHTQKYHSGKPMLPHVCSYCGKGYPNRYCLNQHLLRHTGERPFKCSYCPKTFTLKPLLKQHERFHTGERPYACEVCRKKFVSAALLSMHKKNMHPEYC